MNLTRDAILALDDVTTKEIRVPDNIPVWGGKTLKIRQLTRGMQDAYLKRQFGTMGMRQDARAKQQDISGLNMYGHDAWLCTKGIVNDDGSPMFKETDIDALNKKSGEAIGWIATQIVEFSGMAEDKKVASGELTPEEKLAEAVKN